MAERVWMQGRAREGPTPGGHLVHDRAKGELVGLRNGRPAGRLLGRHVADGPEDDAEGRRRPDAGVVTIRSLRRRRLEVPIHAQLREPEVEDLGEPVAGLHGGCQGLRPSMLSKQEWRIRQYAPLCIQIEE